MKASPYFDKTIVDGSPQYALAHCWAAASGEAPSARVSLAPQFISARRNTSSLRFQIVKTINALQPSWSTADGSIEMERQAAQRLGLVASGALGSAAFGILKSDSAGYAILQKDITISIN